MVEQLLTWYRIHCRELPWRDTRDAYAIWISEVILQQTRVAQGYDYYLRFMARFPTVATLAAASEEEVLKAWQGLGYYSRARNLHVAANQVMNRFGGRFPEEYEGIRSLKGVGDYTAAAIASFAFDLPYAVVDGNVYRVLSRLFGIGDPIDSTKGRRLFAELAQELIDSKQAAEYNQAIMEFGAMQCIPRNPDCAICPMLDRCVAFADGRVSELPVKQGKVSIRVRHFYYIDLRCGSEMLLHRRQGEDIWKGLFELPLIESATPLTDEEWINHPQLKEWLGGVSPKSVRVVLHQVKHQLSHQRIFATFIVVEVAAFSEVVDSSFQVVEVEQVGAYAVSRLTHRYFEESGLE